MSRGDSLLDLFDPFTDPTESWQDKEWGTLYCMYCGGESETVEEIGFGAAWFECPTCQSRPAPSFKPGYEFAWYAVLFLAISGPVALAFGEIVGGVTAGLAVWVLNERTEPILRTIVGD